MKNFKILFCILFISSISLTSCGTFKQNYSNIHASRTDVILQEANFRVIRKVEASAKANYVFGIGGLAKKGLVATAKSRMYEAADLEGAQIIIKENVEWKRSTYIGNLWGSRSVTVSGLIIEFTR